MRGGALIPRDFNGHDLTNSFDEEDVQRMDQIQVHFTTFCERNLSMTVSEANSLIDPIMDTGESDPGHWRNFGYHSDRAKMYWLLSTALGRVPMPTYLECGTEYQCIFFTEKQMQDLDGGLWLQDTGRSGGRNRYMGILQQALGQQTQAYQDVQQYEGARLPFYLPYVLAEKEWDQIFDDVIKDWGDYDPVDDDASHTLPDEALEDAMEQDNAYGDRISY